MNLSMFPTTEGIKLTICLINYAYHYIIVFEIRPIKIYLFHSTNIENEECYTHVRERKRNNVKMEKKENQNYLKRYLLIDSTRIY